MTMIRMILVLMMVMMVVMMVMMMTMMTLHQVAWAWRGSSPLEPTLPIPPSLGWPTFS